MSIDEKNLARARSGIQQAVQGWIYDPNVMLIDFGWPERGGKLLEDELAIRVHVKEKYTRGLELEAAVDDGKTRGYIPDVIAGFPVDRPVGNYRLNQYYSSQWWRPPSQRARRAEPMKGGISISNANWNVYATLGALVKDRETEDPMLLSNWHVLVRDWYVQPDLPIYQPGRGDGGTNADAVATLSRHAMSSNLDAAVARLTGNRQLVNDQLGLGPVKGVGRAELGMQVAKSGRRTELTYGSVTAIYGTVRMNYRGVDRLINNVVTIEPRLVLSEVSAGGDSGSLWCQESTMIAVGLHFAGSDEPKRALAMDLQPVLEALDVELVF
jgi:endonuclease G